MTEKTAISYSEAEITEFDRLCEGTSSPDQVKRITARMTLRKFVEQHGKPKCDAMYSELDRRQKKGRA